MDASFAAYYAWLRMQAGDCDTALVVGYGSPSEGTPERVLNLTLDPYYQAPLGMGPMATSALQASAYMGRSGAEDRDLAEIAARNRNAGANNPNAQVREAATAEELMKTPYAIAPLREGYIAPVGESATCLILAAEGKAETMCSDPVWIHGVDQRAELQSLGSRDLSRSAGTELAAEKALAMAGLDSAAQVGLLETAAANPVEEMIVRESLHLESRGDAGVDINPSGGPQVGNPLMMSGLIRMGEVFQRLSDGAGSDRAIAHATQGHCLQQNIVWVLGRDRRWT
jgi:acetyl-CoA acetyltransferase